uniref:Uncharacterized protein n=1 Tax=Rhizophora mucronata TaxID=61149 RepID=A0A2P2PR49_RHIMU
MRKIVTVELRGLESKSG